MELTETQRARTAGVFFPDVRKRFQNPFASTGHVLRIDRSGTVLDATPSARTLLEYAPNQEVERCFFSLVHSKNLYQVMRDVADMIVHGKRSAEWFLRLRTGRQRWQWYQVRATNDGAPDAEILVELNRALDQ